MRVTKNDSRKAVILSDELNLNQSDATTGCLLREIALISNCMDGWKRKS